MLAEWLMAARCPITTDESDCRLSLSCLQLTCGLERIQKTRGKKCVAYSFGVEQESSWEAEILQRTECEIYMFDFSVNEVCQHSRDARALC